jgi:hypothetical protein
MVDVAVAIVTLPDHDSIIAIPMLTDDITIAITIAITVMTVADGNAHANRANTNAYFFSTRRHRQRNSSHRDGSH